MSIGGRSRIATRPTRTRGTVIKGSTGACLTESFTGAAWPIGADLTWDEGHQGTMSNSGGSISDDGSTSAKRTLHVVSNALTIKAPDDSQLTGGHQWHRTEGYARATGTLPTADMTVTATISGVSAVGAGLPQWVLIARSATNATEFFPSGFLLGWVCYFGLDYCSFQADYVSSTFSPGDMVNGFTDTATVNPSFAWTPADADQISLSVTGTGASTVVDVVAGGVPAMTLNSGNSWGGVLYAGDTSADFPAGTQAGLGLFLTSSGSAFDDLTAWDHGAWDDVMTLDDFSACPA